MKTKKRIYLSIPISGQEAKSRLKAAQLQKHFEEQGYEVVNPHEMADYINQLHRLLGKPKPTWSEYMAVCLPAVESCQVIYFCKGWEESDGCASEYIYASRAGLELMHE
jgi:hypothetical protein